MKIKGTALFFFLLFGILSCSAQQDWQRKVDQELLLLGHRNWIVIADSAYPLQSSPGVETIETNSDQLAVLNYVLQAISRSRHVRPLVHLDKELQFVPESDAPGVEQYRKEVQRRIGGLSSDSGPHLQLIQELKETGESFHVLILKSQITIPYSTVFLQLDCRYWSEKSEARLQEAMKKAQN